MTDWQDDADRLWIREALDTFEAPLIRFARRIVKDEALARDVVQDTFLKLWRGGRHEATHLAAWLYTVCRNRAIDVVRRDRRLVALDQEALERVEAPEVAPAQDPNMAMIFKALDGLPANQAEVIRLKFQSGLSYKDISQVTGLSVSNVGYLIHMGVKALRSQMGPGGAEPPATASGASAAAQPARSGPVSAAPQKASAPARSPSPSRRGGTS